MKKLFFTLFAFAALFTLAAEDINVRLTPTEIDGTPRRTNSRTSSGYGSSTVQAQLRLDLKEDTDAVHFIRDNSDPYVLTKVYELKHADPYSLRGYLWAVANSRRVASSQTAVDALRFNNGRGLLIVAAEDYRFRDFANGESIDKIIERLDQPDMAFSPGRPRFIYFPRANTAANLLGMVRNVGAAGDDCEFNNGTDVLRVDGQLNALMVTAPFWSWKQIRMMLEQYDLPLPEVRLSYKLIEIYAENDDRIGVDFQSWKNNDGVDFFSAGGRYRSNWASTFAGGVNGSGSSKTEFYNFNPKWNSKYLDFLTSKGKAKLVASGTLTARNRKTTRVQVLSGLFYFDVSKTIPPTPLNDIIPEGKPKVPSATDANGVLVSPGDDFLIQHGKYVDTKAYNGFFFDLSINPVVTAKSTQLKLSLAGNSLIGWDSNGSPRISRSAFDTEIQVGNDGKGFVVGGIQKAEVVRGTTGLPILKDLPFLGWLFSTESESTKRSQLVLLAYAEYTYPDTRPNTVITENIGKIVDDVRHGVTHPISNLGFEQLGLDTNTLE